MTFLLLLWGCTGAPSSVSPLPPEKVGAPTALARVEPTRIDLPHSSRPQDEKLERIPILGPFELIRTVEGVSNWEARLPVRPRNLFFSKPSPGMEVYGPEGEKLTFDRDKNTRADSWKFTAETLILRLPEGASQPKDGAFSMIYPKAIERENSLNFNAAGLEEDEFVRRSLQLGPDTRTGLLLPAPASATWTVSFPANAALQLDGVVLPPEAAALESSDGAVLVVEVDGEEHYRKALQVGEWSPHLVDLSTVSGEHELTLRTEGGESDVLDYVFLAEPTLYTPSTDPRRVLVVFLDTLRADHLSSYGYERDTSPTMAAWAEQNAVVFEDARSVAPWTLPTTRSVLTGNHPERYGASKRLPEYLAEQGWATGAFVGNVYLSSNFDMAQGWAQHGCVNWPRIEAQIEKVDDFVERHPNRDLLVMLHTMDMHLPYTEPRKYRRLYTGDAPGDLGDRAVRSPVLRAYKNHGDPVKDWVIGRYDNNIRYTDDQLMPLIERMDPDVVVIFSDHGEEFWDHGGFEHGHTLYDEILRVPIIIMGPGIEPGRVTAPVSNLDLTPTILDLLDVPYQGLDGWSLVPLTHGEQVDEFEERIRSVGRPLYGEEQWGVLVGDTKWTSHDGKEQVFDLASDPGEETNLVDSAELTLLRSALGTGLGTQSPVLWRLEMGKLPKKPKEPVVLSIEHPGGFEMAWLGQDPLRRADATLEIGLDGVVRVTYQKLTGSPEIYLVPADGIGAVEGLTLTQADDQKTAPLPDPLPEALGHAERLWTARLDGRSVRLFYAVAPIPLPEWSELDATDAELNEALKALGYQDREDEQ